MSWPMLIMPLEPAPTQAPNARRRRIARVMAWLSTPLLTVCLSVLLALAATHLVQLHGVHERLDRLLDALTTNNNSSDRHSNYYPAEDCSRCCT